MTREKTSRKKFHPSIFTHGHAQRTTILYFVKRKAICEMTPLRVTVIALSYESVQRGTKTKEIEKKNTTRNWTNQIKLQTHQKLARFAPRMYVSLFLCLLWLSDAFVYRINSQMTVLEANGRSLVNTGRVRITITLTFGRVCSFLFSSGLYFMKF